MVFINLALRVTHVMKVMHMFVVQAQRIACLARQSGLGLDLQIQPTLLPR